MTGHFSHTVSRMGEVISNITNGNAIGNVLVGLGAAITGFLAPVTSLLAICFATTVADMIFGIRVARKQNKKIESNKNWKGTLRKIIDEFTIILLAHGIEWSVFDESGVFLITGGVTVIVTLTELWSIIENLNTLDPGGPWRILGKFLKKKGEDYTGIDLDFDDEHTDDATVGEDSLENRS